MKNKKTCGWLDPQVSEADHFANCKAKGFCIRCDLHRNRHDYDACAMLANKQSWLTTGAHRGLWGHGLQAMRSIRSHWRAHGIQKV